MKTTTTTTTTMPLESLNTFFQVFPDKVILKPFLITFDVDYDFDDSSDYCDLKMALSIYPNDFSVDQYREFTDKVMENLDKIYGTDCEKSVGSIDFEQFMESVNDNCVDEMITDFLSDTSGWCVNGVNCTIEMY